LGHIALLTTLFTPCQRIATSTSQLLCPLRECRHSMEPAVQALAQHGPNSSAERSDVYHPVRRSHAQIQGARDYWIRQREKLEQEQAPQVCVPRSWCILACPILLDNTLTTCRCTQPESCLFQGLRFYFQGYLGQCDYTIKKLVQKQSGLVRYVRDAPRATCVISGTPIRGAICMRHDVG
jgi:hypothetical protein